ncbi:MAG: hypothetical protein ACR2HX_16590 [Pyrinomonadaceae bacterium]
MSHRSFFISVTLSVLLVSLSVRSQERAPGRGLDESAAELRKKAVDLLQSVADQVDSLHSAENRARIGSNVAELLWNHDEKRSRSLFAAVEQDIKAGFNEADPNDSGQNQTLMVFGQLRRDTVPRIAKHDPDLALEFLRATRPASDLQLPYQMRDVEKSLELRLAGQIAAKNPQLALKLGRESLAEGFSAELVSVLSQLQPRDREASLSFFKAIVEKLKSANLARDPGATTLAVHLAQSFPPPEADEQVYRELIGLLLASALANGCADMTSGYSQQICFEIGSVFPRIEKYYAQGAAPLKRWAEAGLRHYAPPMPAQVREAIENGTVDEILALAGKYPEMSRQVYWAAMSKAEASGDVARARRIVSDFPDVEQRRYMLAQIDREQMWTSMNADKLASLQQELSRLRTSEQRIQFLFHVASQIGANDRKAALALLNQAGQIIDSTRPGKKQLEGQLALAMVYCSLKSERGFAIMETLMPKLNELVAASAALDGFENNYLRDGEWNMTGAGAVGGVLTALAQNAGYFARLDFDRSVTLASQFERAELRLMAHLKIAQSVLANQPKQFPMFRLN